MKYILLSFCCALVLGCSGPRAVCGDGEVGGSEECDDGNTSYGDGCTSCVMDTGYACDDATGCEPVCGDHFTVDAEVCDPSDFRWDDYCSDDCTMITGSCGDDVLQPRELCDDGNTVTSDGCSSECRAAFGFTCTDNVCDATDVDPTVTFGEISDEDLTTFCTWLTTVVGGPGRSVTCDNGLVYTVNTPAQCVTALRGLASISACTVAQFEGFVADGGSACGFFTSRGNPC